ncbi:MAG: DUF4147 domain-containing protein [Patescibacteria group bacterium]|nr:DUF4147 domain-containing protein [Patescibacteria group bacterium]
MAHRIQNFDLLATDPLRTDALSIAEAAYAAVNVCAALTRTLRIEDGTLHVRDATYRLGKRRIFFVGVGKCARAAAEAIEDIFGDSLTGGIAFDVSESAKQRSLTKIETFIGTHPLPSETNEQATKRILEFLSGRTKDDLVIMLISGGGSTLLCLPKAPMLCEDERVLWSELTAKGASIQDINTVRKHISRARGGALAAAAYPAEVLSLIVSDVPGNDIEYIASGPTVLDTSTVADAKAVLTKHNVSSAERIQCVETPKDKKFFERVSNVLFLTNQDALSAMETEATKRGYAVSVVSDRLSGEARDIGKTVAAKLHGAPQKTALLYAGESTVTIDTRQGGGRGGRNQETALAALEDIRPGELVLPFASDGHDNTDHAGAVSDSATRARAEARSLSISEYLTSHRSYDFFTMTGDALRTGYTGSNVSDLIVAIKQ